MIFGDLGNDWLVGGTGNDTIWGGWGNDLMNADDDLAAGCASTANNGNCLQYGDTWLNDIPDTHPSYEDRVYGGAGLDVLIGNTGGDRLIDWVGEFNSYLVPFAPFGIATVSRQVEPQLPEFLYALSHSQGADPTRVEDNASLRRRAERRAERRARPRDRSRITASGSSRPAARATRRPGTSRAAAATSSAPRTSTTARMQGFAVDSGVWTGRGRRAQRRRGARSARTRRRCSTSTSTCRRTTRSSPRSQVTKPTAAGTRTPS